MRLSRLRLQNHRNYAQLELTPGPGVNVFIGPNGQGKTNLLEAIYFLATTNEVGDSKAEMAADVDGSDIQIAFNARYVLDALGVIGEDEVELLFDGPLSPGLMRPPGKEHYLYVIMPVRVAMS